MSTSPSIAKERIRLKCPGPQVEQSIRPKRPKRSSTYQLCALQYHLASVLQNWECKVKNEVGNPQLSGLGTNTESHSTAVGSRALLRIWHWLLSHEVSWLLFKCKGSLCFLRDENQSWPLRKNHVPLQTKKCIAFFFSLDWQLPVI